MTSQTLLLIKPNAIEHRHVGHIITILEESGFHILKVKDLQFTAQGAGEFYAMHQGKDFFDRLVKFMISGPNIALLLEKENAVEELRKLVGSAIPQEREPGTIRHLYAEGIAENAVHASDTDENARREIKLIFGSDTSPELV
ncbi:MAG: nucleoside-diphosphate kinase [Candidatus Cloacimonetes bacterium]|nr:nucleoside-diphosphate kinase [Candidatus Cloacimonadota bacterium]